jgi:hypothetical protein
MHEDAGHSPCPGIAEQMGFDVTHPAEAGPARVIDLSNATVGGGEQRPRRRRRGQEVTR